MLKKYKISFDIWALLLFLTIMIPNFIWLAIPAPHDILRADSITGTIDFIASVCQVLMIASLCFLRNSESQKIRVTPFIVGTGVCCLLYYVSWLVYYLGLVGTIVILGLTVSPCLAFLFYAIDRKNRIAIIPILLFTAGHFIYAIANFIA
ncbi:MAG: hypothetical protein GX245_00870 [Eubacteriaceae bacterium]|jgi:hypothetical protein|nr:hypothetical protein [Eubacteriaceae bacterium]